MRAKAVGANAGIEDAAEGQGDLSRAEVCRKHVVIDQYHARNNVNKAAPECMKGRCLIELVASHAADYE